MEMCTPEKAGLDPFDLNRLDPLFEEYMEKPGLPGFSILVARRGKICYSRSWGFASDSLFRIYSMTKPITVAAFLRLYERGLCTLHDPVERYIPSFKRLRVLKHQASSTLRTVPLKEPVTLHHLLTMTAGLSYGFHPEEDPLDRLYVQDGARRNIASLSLGDCVDALSELPLAFQPGSSYRYSLCLDVIARVIEVLSGESFEDFVHNEILLPLKMEETFFDPPEEIHPRLAPLYTVEPGGVRQLIPPGIYADCGLFPGMRGGAGLYSTGYDYIRFCQMLLDGGRLGQSRILGRKSVDLMSRGALGGKPLTVFQKKWPGYNYGLGVRVMENPAVYGLNGSVGEFGWDGAAGGWMMVDPKEEMVAVLMQQVLLAQQFPVARQFAQILYGALL